MKEKALSILLVAATITGVLAGCGGKSEGKGTDAGGGEGKVINIYSWNDEFHQRAEAAYPEVEKTSDGGTVTTLKDGTGTHWIVNPSQDGVYQQELDEALMKQADVAEDERIDIFLSETDRVNKHTDAEVDAAIPFKDLGIDSDRDLTDQYGFTRVAASDVESVQRGSTQQYYPKLLVYRRDIAEEVFGADDPAIIGEKMNNWDTLKTITGELTAKGYFTFASYADTFRLYGNSIAQSRVVNSGTTIKVDEQTINWIKDSEEWLGAQYFNKTTKGRWDNDWDKTMGSESKVFTFLLPVWGIDFVLSPNQGGEVGVWAVITPPQEYNWRGSYVHAVTGTGNMEHVKDIVLAVTADRDNLLKTSKDYADFTNTKSGTWEATKDDSFALGSLGGQNSFVYCVPVAEKVKIAPLSAYDQSRVELIQSSFGDYFRGKVDYDKAKVNFETAVKECYPNITEVEWHEQTRLRIGSNELTDVGYLTRCI